MGYINDALGHFVEFFILSHVVMYFFYTYTIVFLNRLKNYPKKGTSFYKVNFKTT